MRSSRIRKELNKCGLEIPLDLDRELLIHEEMTMINGVGGQNPDGTDAWYNWLIPKTIKGIPMAGPAIIHDWDFFRGDNLEAFLKANRDFLDNQIFVCDRQNLIDNKDLKHMRKCHDKCMRNFSAVDKYGLSFFSSEANRVMIGHDLKRAIEIAKKRKRKADALGEGDMF